ncbi:MAG: hypothetical protein M0Z76_02560 [Gammaproteobacteria bacterium]|nr:hypothetical protein [Gammaproteobacteria bacterium]
MCFCESDAVRILIHIKARKQFPGIGFDESALSRTAARLRITETAQIRKMSPPELQRMSLMLLGFLPPAACPPAHRQAV